MTLRSAVLIMLALAYQWKCAHLLESVEELLCKNLNTSSRIPHPELCNVYIMCTDNAAMQISCEGRILYNPVTEVCDASYRICLHGLIRDKNGTIISYKNETTEISETISDEDNDDEEYETEDEGDVDDEEETDEESDSGTEISEITKTSTKNPPIQTTTQSTTSKNPSSNSGPQHPVPITCPKVDNDNLLLIGHATKCSVYFVCYHSKPIPMECALGLYWSEKNYKCVPRELSECHERSESQQYPKCPPNGIDFLPHDTNCQHFWFCRDGFRMLQQCDAFDQWDVYEKKCKRRGESICYRDLLKTMIT